ncbi:hypothetical protein FA15DRAFT_251781 [Coprinopsis marcescibilis]|uniref:Uncharacterized protein n=1 Tax=Coprinopsis marcescibilis TaxID=230819 RepID=A0A5C3L2H0_COPMA|nr:hypothetical protein FA15DRAFT_251781 [Coprinopsis marcescibilis]
MQGRREWRGARDRSRSRNLPRRSTQTCTLFYVLGNGGIGIGKCAVAASRRRGKGGRHRTKVAAHARYHRPLRCSKIGSCALSAIFGNRIWLGQPLALNRKFGWYNSDGTRDSIQMTRPSRARTTRTFQRILQPSFFFSFLFRLPRCPRISDPAPHVSCLSSVPFVYDNVQIGRTITRERDHLVPPGDSGTDMALRPTGAVLSDRQKVINVILTRPRHDRECNVRS